MMQRIYLAAPYSHPDPAVMEARVLAADAAAVRLMQTGLIVYSPLSHWHRAAQAHGLPTNALFWRDANWRELMLSDALHVLKLDGWKDSQGLAWEIAWAEETEMRIVMRGLT